MTKLSPDFVQYADKLTALQDEFDRAVSPESPYKAAANLVSNKVGEAALTLGIFAEIVAEQCEEEDPS